MTNVNVTIENTMAEILAAYNARAVANGMKPLAGYKNSKPSLIEKLEALPPMPADFSVIAFAGERGVDPKSARAALRKNGFAAPYRDSIKLREIIMAIKPRARA